MKTRQLSFLILAIVIVYPAYSLFRLASILNDVQKAQEVYQHLTAYKISIWISWVIFAAISIYNKWTQKVNLFFYITYAFLVLAFAFFGIYMQEMMENFDIRPRFDHSYDLGILSALMNFGVAVVLTFFLQSGVWWLTRSWHRS